jgi:hypothetical protein
MNREEKNDVFRIQMAFLECVLERKGFTVKYVKDIEDCVEFTEQIVYINSRNHPENRFYTMLHELGHVIIGEDEVAFEADNPMYVHSKSRENASPRSHAYRVSLISEEIEAWKQGRRFAKALGFYVDDNKYNKHMTKYVMTYIDWASS